MRKSSSLLISLQPASGKVGDYGACINGSTLLNFAGVLPHLSRSVESRGAETRQGKFMPGSRMPIVAAAHLRDEKFAYITYPNLELKTEVVALPPIDATGARSS